MSDERSDNTHLRVFLCHASEDKPVARQLRTYLREDGVKPWLDKDELLPGQDWNLEIRTAVRQSHAILVLLSSRSVRKEGYFQKELKLALDVAEEKPDGTIFIIPVKLDDCQLPERLANWQWIETRDEDAYPRLLRSLRARAEECGIEQLPGEGPLVQVPRPSHGAAISALYETADVRKLLQMFRQGEIIPDDAPDLPHHQVVAISDEALRDVLGQFWDDDRRSQEKATLLGLVGVRSPYREWQEAATKHHCFRNDPDRREVAQVIEHVPVHSSNLRSVGYDPTSQILEVRFRDGRLYQYFGVPEHLYHGLLDAPSHGKYLAAYIKGPYRYAEIH